MCLPLGFRLRKQPSVVTRNGSSVSWQHFDSLVDRFGSSRAIFFTLDICVALRLENSEKEKRIFSLENRVDELEQYTRINNIIITGLETKSRSYARAARMTGGDTSEEDATSVELQVTAFLNSKGIEIDSDNIEACHPLPRRNKTDKPAIIIRFANRKHKIELLKQGRRLKGSDLNGSPEQAKVFIIRDLEELEKYQ
ncbi:hypothetical protein NQZ68_012568 [Dissostichus eleginoides]|nr:hypothetical protein NQZ68_012568 [Dissostichus eleginoides]